MWSQAKAGGGFASRCMAAADDENEKGTAARRCQKMINFRAPQPFAMVAPPSDSALTDALVVVAAALLKARALNPSSSARKLTRAAHRRSGRRTRGTRSGASSQAGCTRAPHCGAASRRAGLGAPALNLEAGRADAPALTRVSRRASRLTEEVGALLAGVRAAEPAWGVRQVRLSAARSCPRFARPA
jgi:hypothetical protein